MAGAIAYTIDYMVRLDGLCRRSHVVFLVLTFLTMFHFFNTNLLNIHVWRLLDWVYTLGLFLYVVNLLVKGKILKSWLSRWRYMFIFIGLVLLSFFYLIMVGQKMHQTYRVSYIWFQLLLLVVLLRNKFTIAELYRAVAIYSVIWFCAWILGFLSPVMLFDASGEYDDSSLSAERGVVRLNIVGSTIMHLWGLWSLGIYLKTKKSKFLFVYFLCLFFIILQVSRQHIVYYSAIGFITFLYKSSWLKKVLFVIVLYYIMMILLPKTVIYQSIVALTEYQLAKNDGGRNDVRILAIEYYIKDFPQNSYTVLFGHGKYHSDSPYGKQVNHVIDSMGYVLSDIGWVGTYIYYGLAGLFCMFFMLYDVARTKTTSDFLGIKLYFCFLALGSIFSHSIELSPIGIALGLYILFLGNQAYNLQLPLMRQRQKVVMRSIQDNRHSKHEERNI